MKSLSQVNWPKIDIESARYDSCHRDMYNILDEKNGWCERHDWYERKRKGKRKKSWKDYQWDE